MSDCIILTRFWDEYPLETIVAEVAERFTVGPFRGEAKPANGATPAKTVLLRFADGGSNAPVAVPPGSSSWVSRGPVAYRVERTRMPPRVKRRILPDLGVVLGVGFGVAVVAAILYGSWMSPPELHELDEGTPAIAPAETVRGTKHVRAGANVGTTPRLSLGSHDPIE